MLSVSLVLFTALLYLMVLFSIASRGERKAQPGKARPWRYTLALGVHCTTWAFYGTITQAAHYGWWFAPTYLGGILVFLFAHELQIKLLKLVKKQNLTSIADLIGARYNKSQGISAVVALISLVALVPYIALQLRAVSASFSAVTGVDASRFPWFSDLSAGVALAMIGFAILFGARKLSLSEQHSGLMDAVAFESVVKLGAFMIVGLFCTYQLFGGLNDLLVQASQSDVTLSMLEGRLYGMYIYATHMLLGGLAMFVLPRQFQVNFIENNDESELKTARWAFPLYLFAINFFILPIALAGGLLVPEFRFQDTFMLALPVLAERPDISLIAFIGGLASAVSMVIMATLALSIMISNDVITPLWLRTWKQRSKALRLTPGIVLTIRRLTMVVIIVLAYIYHNITQSGIPLVSNGLIAMALLAQLAPPMIGGLIWTRASKAGAIAGLVSGTVLWVWLLFLPSLQVSRTVSTGISDLDISHGVVLSLLANILAYVIVSFLKPGKDAERMQASRFTQPELELLPGGSRKQVTWGRLRSVLQRFIDERDAARLDQRLGITIEAAPADGLVAPDLLQQVERELAGVIGSSASRLVLQTVAREPSDAIDDVVDWASEASQVYRFNRELLQASVENIPQGISVIDKDLRLVAWNRRYLEIFNYPDGFIQAGKPVEEVLRFNAERGLFGQPESDIQEEINKRLEYLKQGSSYRYQRQQQDGRIIELQGSPMPDGGFVTTYTDITELVKVQSELEKINAELELRVDERTEALTKANREMLKAKHAAEEAHSSKSRFFAAAGHDLMQPFSAATLFCEMLQQRIKGQQEQELASQIHQSLQNAEELLSMLLEMTKLESGRLKPDKQPVHIGDIMRPLAESFRALAQEKGLDLRMRYSSATVITDKKLLQRVLQNLLSNAVRYSDQGKVVCGVRRRSETELELQVLDTGRGIPQDKLQEIFHEFRQLEQQDHNPGLGLGLAIVDRMCRLMEAPISVTSIEGKGTCFSIRLPVLSWREEVLSPQEKTQAAEPSPLLLDGYHIVVLDNDKAIRDALSSLLSDWGASIDACHTGEEVMQLANKPHLIIADYHLDNDDNGVDVIRRVREHWGETIPALVATADPNESVRERVVEVSAQFLPKPVKQAALKRLLKRLLF